MKPLLMRLALAALLAAPGLGHCTDDKVAGLIKDLANTRDEAVRLNAALALGQLGKAAVGPVAAALADQDPDVRYYAVWAMGLIGPDARDKAGDVIKLLGDKSEQVRRKAVFALGRIAPSPTETLPLLIQAMGDDNADVRTTAASAAAGFGKAAVAALVAALQSPKVVVRVHAADALGIIGPDARDALPRLAALLKDKDAAVLAVAAQALARLGKVSLPALTEATQSSNNTARRHAIEAVGQIDGPEAVIALVDALQSPHADVRNEAAQILGRLRINDKLITQSLTHSLTDADEAVREAALLALNNTGTDPIRAMREHLKGADLTVRVRVATLVLHRINNDHPEATAILTDALKAKEPDVRYQAAFSFALTRQSPGETVGVLIEALKDRNAEYRRQAAAGLGHLLGKTERATPALAEAVGDADAAVRRQVAQALGQGGEGRAALPALAVLVKDADASVRLHAVRSLGRFDRDAVPHLKTPLRDEEAEVRRETVTALTNMTADAGDLLALLAETLKDGDATVRQLTMTSSFRFREDAGPLYLAGLKDSDSTVRYVAANYLGQLPNAGRKAMPLILDLAKTDPDANVRHNSVLALSHLGEAAIPALTELVVVRDLSVRQDAMLGLQRHGAKAKGAVPNLVEVLKGADVASRRLAAKTLGGIGPDARDALDTLKEAARGGDAELKTVAEAAINSIERK